MTSGLISARLSVGLQIRTVDQDDLGRVMDSYCLLRDEMGDGAVEDPGSFLRSVSSVTDPQVVPALLCATYGGEPIGVVLSAYLKALNMGMMLYSAVRSRHRGRGVYSGLRARVVEIMDRQAGLECHGRAGSETGSPRVSYLMSELDTGGPFFHRYIDHWGAHVAPCDYEQPPVQGLASRRMSLVFQPIAQDGPPPPDEIPGIVLAVYRHIYRIPDPAGSPVFRRVVGSMRLPCPPQGSHRGQSAECGIQQDTLSEAAAHA